MCGNELTWQVVDVAGVPLAVEDRRPVREFLQCAQYRRHLQVPAGATRRCSGYVAVPVLKSSGREH